MKRSGLIILAIVAILVIWGISVRNGLATQETGINGKWGEVETQFQRKKNLYENVVATIKVSAKNEDTSLIKIVKLRSRIPDLDPNNPATINEANAALGQMKQAIMN